MRSPATPSFLGEAAFGFVLALAGAVLAAMLGLVTDTEAATRALIVLLGLGYLSRLLKHADSGRVAGLALWCLVAGLGWLLHLPLGMSLLAQAALIWLLRSAGRYSRPLPAVLDLGLCASAAGAAAATAAHTGSVLLAAWCFFLVQALHVAIPERSTSGEARREDRFDDARRTAEAALRRLTRAL